jgi:hypothetical protein
MSSPKPILYCAKSKWSAPRLAQWGSCAAGHGGAARIDPDRVFGSGGAEIVRSSFEFLGEGLQGAEAQSGGKGCLSQAQGINDAGGRHGLMAHSSP